MKSLIYLVLLQCGFIFLATAAYADEMTLAVQRALKTRHLYYGQLDGIPGSQTSAAIRRFQLEQHLNVTGEISDQVLTALGIYAYHRKTKPVPTTEELALAELFSGGPFANESLSEQRDLYKAICNQLHNQGYLRYAHPPIDSPQLNRALKNWQRKHHLPTSGRIDTATARKLAVRLRDAQTAGR